MAEKIYDASGSQIGSVATYSNIWNSCDGLPWSPDKNAQVEYIILLARKLGTVTSGTLTIRAGGNNPTEPGDVLYAQVFDPSSWSSSVAERTVTLDTFLEIDANTNYCLMLSCNGADASNKLDWSRDSAQYFWGSTDSGSSWTRNDVGSLNFDIWGSFWPDKAINPVPANAATGVLLGLSQVSWESGP